MKNKPLIRTKRKSGITNTNIPLPRDNKILITPEAMKKHRLIFNRNQFGYLKFFLGISYKKSNVFFTFYCKSMDMPSKVFVFFKESVGMSDRAKLKGTANLRGRFKKQFEQIKNKFNRTKAYIYEFIKAHPEIAAYKQINIVWKIYRIDHNFLSLVNQPLEITYSFKIIETVLKEQLKDKILSSLNLRDKLNIPAIDIIYKEFVKKNTSQIDSYRNLFQYIFKKNKKKQLQGLKEDLDKRLTQLPEPERLAKLQLMTQLQIELYDKRYGLEVTRVDPVYFFLGKIALIAGLTITDVMNLMKIREDLIQQPGIYKSNLLKYNKFLLAEDLQSYETRTKKQKEIKIMETDSTLLKPKTYKDKIVVRFTKFLDKVIRFPRDVIEYEQPLLLHHFIFKFPHNGCRPKKARRVKRTNG
jgi:hypothetical protein